MTHEIANIFSAKLLGFLRDGMLVLIFFNAYLTNAPEKLPATFRDFPQWFWTWNIEALRSFVSARMAALKASHSETTETPGGMKTSNTETISASGGTIPAKEGTK